MSDSKKPGCFPWNRPVVRIQTSNTVTPIIGLPGSTNISKSGALPQFQMQSAGTAAKNTYYAMIYKVAYRDVNGATTFATGGVIAPLLGTPQEPTVDQNKMVVGGQIELEVYSLEVVSREESDPVSHSYNIVA